LKAERCQQDQPDLDSDLERSTFNVQLSTFNKTNETAHDGTPKAAKVRWARRHHVHGRPDAEHR